MRVSAKQVKVRLGGAEILKGVTLEVSDNEFVGVIGPNGSGKSTFLKCIGRILKPQSGEVTLDGTPVASMGFRDVALKVAVFSQHGPEGVDFTVLEMALIGRAPHKRGFERDDANDYALARAALETVELTGLEDRAFSSLSGGERQRAMLAQALAQQAPCLLLDEPTNHLDVRHQLKIMEIVKSLGVTVIAAIHDLNIAAAYCDRLFVMRGGEIIASGTPEEVLTAELIREVYGVESEIARGRAGGLHIIFYPLEGAY